MTKENWDQESLASGVKLLSEKIVYVEKTSLYFTNTYMKTLYQIWQKSNNNKKPTTSCWGNFLSYQQSEEEEKGLNASEWTIMFICNNYKSLIYKMFSLNIVLKFFASRKAAEFKHLDLNDQRLIFKCSSSRSNVKMKLKCQTERKRSLFQLSDYF